MNTLAARLINETKINGLYVNCKLTDQSAADLYTVVSHYLPREILHLAHEYHVTVAYDRKFISSFEEVNKIASSSGSNESPRTALADGEVIWWAGHDNEGYLVLKLNSSALQAIHKKWKLAGVKHSFEDYTPHITLATGLPDPNTTDMKISVKLLRMHLRKTPLNIVLEPESVNSLQ